MKHKSFGKWLKHKLKSNKIKQKVEIPMDTKIALSDIDMVIQEVLQKPTVNIHVS